MKRYLVSAKRWTPLLREWFGEMNTEHVLADDEVIYAIMANGRARICEHAVNKDMRHLEFDNEHD